MRIAQRVAGASPNPPHMMHIKVAIKCFLARFAGFQRDEGQFRPDSSESTRLLRGFEYLKGANEFEKGANELQKGANELQKSANELEETSFRMPFQCASRLLGAFTDRDTDS
jgi:X-X-X-Leu-X-X-Gly heptad repeat protein